MDLLVVGDAGRVVTTKFVSGLGQRLIQVGPHGRAHLVERPRAGVGGGEEAGDGVRIGVPASLGIVEGVGVAGLGRLKKFDGDGDVFVQQRGQCVAGGSP